MRVSDPEQERPRRVWLTVSLLAVVLAGGGGCAGDDQPLRETFQVSGFVDLRPGERASDGLVEFKSRAEPGLMTVGQILSDGSFSLTTRVEGEALPGAVAGLHDVTISVTLPDPQGVQGIPRIVVLPEPVKIEPGDECVLQIELSGPSIEKSN